MAIIGSNITGSNLQLAGDIAVNGGDLTSSQATFNLLNSTVTTLYIGGTTTTSSLQGAAQIDGRSTLSSVAEKLERSIGGTGTVSFNLSLASIFYANGPTGDITANFINVPTTADRVLTPSVILSQSATPRVVTGVQIDAVAQTINWANGVSPAGTANKQDVFGFSLIRSGSAWKVLGQMSTYG